MKISYIQAVDTIKTCYGQSPKSKEGKQVKAACEMAIAAMDTLHQLKKDVEEWERGGMAAEEIVGKIKEVLD